MVEPETSNGAADGASTHELQDSDELICEGNEEANEELIEGASADGDSSRPSEAKVLDASEGDESPDEATPIEHSEQVTTESPASEHRGNASPAVQYKKLDLPLSDVSVSVKS